MRNLIHKTLQALRERWSRRRLAQDTERSLGMLDTLTLRDLGLHRSEVGSAWDLSRRADITRARVARYYPF